MRTLSALAAYGRFPTQADWDAGKDFRAYAGWYFSKRDMVQLRDNGYSTIEFKHGGITRFVVTL